MINVHCPWIGRCLWILLGVFEWCPCQKVSLSWTFTATPFHALFSLCIIRGYWFLESGFYFAINSFQQLDLSLPFLWCLFFKSWRFPFSNLHIYIYIYIYIYIFGMYSLCFVVVWEFRFNRGTFSLKALICGFRVFILFDLFTLDMRECGTAMRQ